MQAHQQDPEIVILDSIREARVFNPGRLKKLFNPDIPMAAIHSSQELTDFCQSIDYTRDGLTEVFGRNVEGLSHSIQTIYKKGQTDFIYFSKLRHEKIGDHYPQMSEKAFKIPGLHQFYGRWNEMFKWYGDYIQPAFKTEFQIRMLGRSDPVIRLHTDHKRYDHVACTPLGDHDSTFVQDRNGRLVIPHSNSTVITKRGCVHTSPPVEEGRLRVVMVAQPIERDPLSGMVFGFGY